MTSIENGPSYTRPGNELRVLVVLEVVLSSCTDRLVVELYSEDVDAMSVDDRLLVDIGVPLSVLWRVVN